MTMALYHRAPGSHVGRLPRCLKNSRTVEDFFMEWTHRRPKTDYKSLKCSIRPNVRITKCSFGCNRSMVMTDLLGALYAYEWLRWQHAELHPPRSGLFRSPTCQFASNNKAPMFLDSTVMYIRADHAETSVPALHEFMKANPLGIFTTTLKADEHPFIQCSHIPFVLDVGDESDEANLGKLRGHMARANPQAKAIVDAAKLRAVSIGSPVGAPVTLEEEVLVLFNAPVHHYVSAKSYVETKPSSGKVVPTWNYAAVQTYGRLTVYFDSKSDSTASFLHSQITDLSNMAETDIMGFKNPWKVTDAPANYISAMTKAIIGIEIQITRLAGKWKMSQEAKPGDRAGIVASFKDLGTATGDWMAETIEQRSVIADTGKLAK